jgi:hypothetical protein
MTAPRLAVWADRLVFALLALTVLVDLTGGIRVGDDGYRLSITSGWRLPLYALAVVLARHLLVPHPSMRERWIARRQARATSGWPGERLFLPARRELLWASLLLGLATAWTLRNQLLMLNGVPDLGDPLFSMWRLATVARQLVTDPAHLFSGNIFYPAADVLAYSDAILLPALLAAPFLWVGVPIAIVYGLMCALSFFASGLSMFVLVRAMTRQFLPALVAAVCFAFYPYRFSSYSHLEKLGVFFMPVALLLLWRVLQVGRRSEGIALGLTVAAQTLWSLYLGAFLTVGLAAVAILRWAAGHFRWRERWKPLLAGGLVAAVIVGPYTLAYWRVRPVVGERARFEVDVFSASRGDLIAVTSANRLYRDVLPAGSSGESHLFPGATALALAAVAIVPPTSPLAAAAAAGVAVGVDGAFGLRGATFRWLYELFPPFRAFRAPGRFSAVAGFFLCLMAGLGLARIIGRPSTRGRQMLATVIVVFAFFELQPTLSLHPAPLRPPDIYSDLPDAGEAVIIDLPVPETFNSFDFSYIYYSTFHLRRLVNGVSGFIPRDYGDIVTASERFPDDWSIELLRRRGAHYAVLHGDFYDAVELERAVAQLATRTDVTLVATRPSLQGRVDRLYRLR